MDRGSNPHPGDCLLSQIFQIKKILMLWFNYKLDDAY